MHASICFYWFISIESMTPPKNTNQTYYEYHTENTQYSHLYTRRITRGLLRRFAHVSRNRRLINQFNSLNQ